MSDALIAVTGIALIFAGVVGHIIFEACSDSREMDGMLDELEDAKERHQKLVNESLAKSAEMAVINQCMEASQCWHQQWTMRDVFIHLGGKTVDPTTGVMRGEQWSGYWVDDSTFVTIGRQVDTRPVKWATT